MLHICQPMPFDQNCCILFLFFLVLNCSVEEKCTRQGVIVMLAASLIISTEAV